MIMYFYIVQEIHSLSKTWVTVVIPSERQKKEIGGSGWGILKSESLRDFVLKISAIVAGVVNVASVRA